jgi:hypothetical protein
VAAAFARAVVPGSYLIISCGSGNRSEGQNFATEYTVARICIHLLAEILGFFGGLDLVPPGVVAVRRWYGDGPDLGLAAPTATFPRRRGPQAVTQLNRDATSLSAVDGSG